MALPAESALVHTKSTENFSVPIGVQACTTARAPYTVSRPDTPTPADEMAPAQTIILVMSKVLPLSEVKARFSEVVDKVVATHERVTVTRNGRPVAVVLSTDDLEAIEETVAILSNPDAVRAIELGRAAIADGDVATREEIESLRERLRRTMA